MAQDPIKRVDSTLARVEADLARSLAVLQRLKDALASERPANNPDGSRPAGPAGSNEAIDSTIERMVANTAAMLAQSRRTIAESREAIRRYHDGA